MVSIRILSGKPKLILAKLQRMHLLLLAVIFTINACTPSGTLHAQERKLVEVVSVQPFKLDKSFKFDWRKERPDVSAGLLVVFKADTSLLRPTNSLQPVLYAGNHTVQRINEGYRSGFIIGIIPAQIDLSKEIVWFGAPELPERVDTRIIRAERAKAVKSGIRPAAADIIKSRTMDVAAAPELTSLLRKFAAPLILKYAPEDKWIVDAWNLPETR